MKRKRGSDDKDEFSNKKNMQVNYLLNGNGNDNEKRKRNDSDDDNRKEDKPDFKNKNKKLVKFGNKRENGLNHRANTSKAKFFGFSSKKRANLK